MIVGMRHRRLLLFLHLCVLALPLAARELRVEPGAGSAGIAAAIKEIKAAGGGTLLFAPGEYLLHEPIVIENAHGLTLRGEPGANLRLQHMAYAELSAAVEAGVTTLPARRAQGLRRGQLLRIMAPGAVHPFTGKPTPHFDVPLAEIRGDTLVLKKPLAFPAPEGTHVLWTDEPNLMEIRGESVDVTIEQLALEGGLIPGAPETPTHNTRSGVWVTGHYDYEKGPLGPKPRGITVRDCRLARFNGRGVAFYSVEEGLVERCSFERTMDEAIDFDHFANRCIARENLIRGCRIGIELNDANDCVIERNRIEGGSSGIRIWRWCKMPELNVRNRVADNLFVGIRGAAIDFFEGTAQNRAEGNQIVAPGKELKDVVRDKGEGNVLVENTVRAE